MKRQLSNTIYGLKFAMEKNDFEYLKSSSEKSEMTLLPTQYKKNQAHAIITLYVICCQSNVPCENSSTSTLL